MRSINIACSQPPQCNQSAIDTVLRTLARSHGDVFAQAFVAEHYAAILGAHRGHWQSFCGETQTYQWCALKAAYRPE